MKERDSFFGVGPHIFAATGAWFALAVLVDCAVVTTWRFESVSLAGVIVTSVSLVVGGLALYLTALRHLLRARQANALCTSGPYRWVRHPLYAAAVFFFTPAVCLLFRSWIIMTTVPMMWIFVLALVRREEASIEMRFGDAFLEYRNRTGALIPRLR